MRKRVLCGLLTLTLLCSCADPVGTSTVAAETGPQPPTAEIPTGAEWADYYAQVILYSQLDGEAYTALSAEDGEFYLSLYGISLPQREDEGFGYAVYTVGGVDVREIAVICGLSGEADYAGAAEMEAYRQGRVSDFTGYVPDQAALAGKGTVLHGDMLALLLCSDPDAAQKALEKVTSHLVLKPFDPAEETPEPYDWTEYVDENGYRIFDPPNKFEMIPYDTSAILKAWATGDENGLSDKDAAIIAKCKEIFRECVKEDMTDFQKELELHSWLTQTYYGCYDRTVQDPATPMGREYNMEPYGLLIRGYGICMAYATTFQLLMDLAGVECITVVGASSSSSGDHAWNMVKLEGEWYCVDPTWDAAWYGELKGEELWSTTHRYFNVTSQEMRDSDHQWDYSNVPEATATRFRWDGTGELPR